LNGELLVEWKTDYSDLSNYSSWQLRDNSVLGVGCESPTVFHKIEVVEVSGKGTLNYSISDDASWLSVSPSNGSSTGEADTISVSYATSGLGAGTYKGTITVSDPSASNNPKTIAVTLTVNPPAAAVHARSLRAFCRGSKFV
jgi:hypothetical protein